MVLEPVVGARTEPQSALWVVRGNWRHWLKKGYDWTPVVWQPRKLFQQLFQVCNLHIRDIPNHFLHNLYHQLTEYINENS